MFRCDGKFEVFVGSEHSHGRKFMDDSIWLIARRSFIAVNINVQSLLICCCRAHHPITIVSPHQQEGNSLQKPLTAENNKINLDMACMISVYARQCNVVVTL